MSNLECNIIIEDGLIITVKTTATFSMMKAAKVKPTKPFLDAMGIIKLSGEICGGVSAKDYAVHKKSTAEQRFYCSLKSYKINNCTSSFSKSVFVVSNKLLEDYIA